MTDTNQSIDSAINLLKKIVKYSAVPGQKHLDLTVAVAEERHLFQEALMFLQAEVERGTLTQEDIKHRLGLI